MSFILAAFLVLGIGSKDDSFIADIATDGIRPDPAIAADAAHLVCWELRGGKTANQVAYEILGSSTLSGYQAGYFVGASIYAYCPQYVGR